MVVEAGARSGALTTAAWALEQGRGLHLVPGRLDDPAVAGCLAFLREAGPEARIVAGIPELLDDLGLLGESRMSAAERRRGERPAESRPAGATLEAVLAILGPVERAIAREVAAGHGSVDELVLATGGPGAMVLGALTSLEIRGLVLETFGRYRAAGPAGVRRRSARTSPCPREGRLRTASWPGHADGGRAGARAEGPGSRGRVGVASAGEGGVTLRPASAGRAASALHRPGAGASSPGVP